MKNKRKIQDTDTFLKRLKNLSSIIYLFNALWEDGLSGIAAPAHGMDDQGGGSGAVLRGLDVIETTDRFAALYAGGRN